MLALQGKVLRYLFSVVPHIPRYFAWFRVVQKQKPDIQIRLRNQMYKLAERSAQHSGHLEPVIQPGLPRDDGL